MFMRMLLDIFILAHFIFKNTLVMFGRNNQPTNPVKRERRKSCAENSKKNKHDTDNCRIDVKIFGKTCENSRNHSVIVSGQVFGIHGICTSVRNKPCKFVQPERIELSPRPWQGRVLPLNHGCSETDRTIIGFKNPDFPSKFSIKS